MVNEIGQNCSIVVFWQGRKKNATTNLKIATSTADLAFCHQAKRLVEPIENYVMISTFRVFFNEAQFKMIILRVASIY